MFEAIINNDKEYCNYCGELAFFYVGKNKTPCCCDSKNKCPEIRKRNSEGLRKAHSNKKNWFNPDYTGWSKGLTKETSESVRKISKTLKKHLEDGTVIPSFTGRKHSEETHRKWKLNPNMGGLRVGSGKGIKGWYKGFYCRSTWELAWLVYQLDHGITVSKCDRYFTYFHENLEHKYYPDFKIESTYYEIKGLRDDRVDSKIAQFPKEETLILIEGYEDNKPFLDYCTDKYGTEFWKLLYEDK